MYWNVITVSARCFFPANGYILSYDTLHVICEYFMWCDITQNRQTFQVCLANYAVSMTTHSETKWIPLSNPWRPCAARVTTVVGLCVHVSTLNLPSHTLNHKREIPTDSSQYRNHFQFLPIFLKMLCSKVMA